MAHQQHWDLARLLRQFREEAGKTQDQLAQELNQHESLKRHGRTISRYGINRIEKGHTSLRLILAAALDAYAEDSGYSSPGFEFLVADLTIRDTEQERGSQVDQMLRAKGYSRLYLVICDTFDFAWHLKSALPTPELYITAVAPTADRIHELFGGSLDRRITRPELFDGYADQLNQHIDDQIHLMHIVCDRSKEAKLEVFESSLVLNSLVLTKGNRETKCVYWPCGPFGPLQFEPNLVPIVDDAAVSAWQESLILAATGRSSIASRIHLGDTFVGSECSKSFEGSDHVEIGGHGISRFHPRKVPRNDTQHDREGAAVALIMPYVCVVESGRREVQVLVQWRSAMSTDEDVDPVGQFGFIATRVFSSTVLKVLDGSDSSDSGMGDNPLSLDNGHLYETYRRERRGSLEDQAAFVVDAIQATVVRADGEPDAGPAASILESAYRTAVLDHLRLACGVRRPHDIGSDGIEPWGEMRVMVKKSYGANIVPRLYCVRLTSHERDTMIRTRRAIPEFGNTSVAW